MLQLFFKSYSNVTVTVRQNAECGNPLHGVRGPAHQFPDQACKKISESPGPAKEEAGIWGKTEMDIKKLLGGPKSSGSAPAAQLCSNPNALSCFRQYFINIKRKNNHQFQNAFWTPQKKYTQKTGRENFHFSFKYWKLLKILRDTLKTSLI